MDIAGLSMSMASNNLKTKIGTAVLSKAMDTNEALGQGIVQMIDSAAMERSVTPELGANIDLRISKNFGAFVAVDNCFSGLIPKKELFGDTELRIGDQVTARVVKVLEDGKLTLSVREKAYLQIQKDAEKIERLLDSYEGSLPFNDKAAPEVIAHETGMSKNEFKRAVGHLLKEGKIQITEKNIRRVRG